MICTCCRFGALGDLLIRVRLCGGEAGLNGSRRDALTTTLTISARIHEVAYSKAVIGGNVVPELTVKELRG